jgi:branched-chain amino acid transport system permease protein
VSFLAQQTVNGIALGSIFALYALGFSLVLANLKVFHLAHAAVFTWGAVAAWQLVSVWKWPSAAGFAVAILLSGLINVVGYYLLIRHLQGRRNLELTAFISSLGGLIVLSELALLQLDH